MFQKRMKSEWILHVMMIPAIIIVLIFSYGPMFGIVIAFQRFSTGKGILRSKWVGLENFFYIFNLPSFTSVIRNTFFIAGMKVILDILCPIIFALLLNEIRKLYFKRVIQTIVYLPHFLSWVILGGIFIDILSPSNGVINIVLKSFGINPIFFLGDPKVFPFTMILTHVWKEVGFGAVIYLAALTSIDPTLYEAAYVDGAGRWKQTLNVTLPGILSTVVLLSVLSLGNTLNAGFDQIFNLYSVQVYSTGDIIDTFVYRLGMIDFQYSAATAVGLFKSVISCIMIVASYKIAYWTTGYKLL